MAMCAVVVRKTSCKDRNHRILLGVITPHQDFLNKLLPRMRGVTRAEPVLKAVTIVIGKTQNKSLVSVNFWEL